MRTILYVGAYRFPNKDAAAKRVLGIGMALRLAGYKVVFAGGEQGCSDKMNLFEGFEYYSMGELDHPERGIFSRFKNFVNAGAKTVSWIETYLTRNKVDAIILYNSSYVFQLKLRNICKRKGITLIGDCTEWYDPAHLPGGRYGPVAIDNYLKMNIGYKRFNGLIVISSYLRKFYEKDVKHIIIVPPLNITTFEFQPIIRSKYRTIIYAGSPGKKDNLDVVINAIHKVNTLQLKILGISRDDYVRCNPNINLSDRVIFLGRVDYDDVIREYKESDFSIIIRPNKRYAHVGFPTKLVESLSCGIPVISTNTSDIAKYIKDSENGFVLRNDSQECVEEIFKKIESFDDKQILMFKANAFRTSILFNYDLYSQKLNDFILSLL